MDVMDAERSSKNGVIGSIDLSSSESAVDLTGQVHQLPCCIKFDGPCPVSDYFKPKNSGIEVEGLSVEEAFFRGRKLQGTTVPLPQGYCGIVLEKRSHDKKDSLNMDEGDLNSWEINAKFNSITFWNHDILPSPDDTHMRCFHWFAVAKALHKPVTAEDLVSVFVEK